MKFYGYFRSSASYRLRIALALKNIPHEKLSVHLTRGGGEQFKPEFRRHNPQELIPVVEDDGQILTQSLAILEYLEETHPEPAILPKAPAERARVRALSQIIACEMHPLNNLRVLTYLTKEMGLSEEAKLKWYRHWIALGFNALEGLLAGHPQTGKFCHGDRPTMADICLVPQVFNAKRFDCPMDAYPTVMRIHDACQALPAFADSVPAKQPDAE
jgi:maleylacetoacetate isomerase/maleylpyruvate isomerase